MEALRRVCVVLSSILPCLTQLKRRLRKWFGSRNVAHISESAPTKSSIDYSELVAAARRLVTRMDTLKKYEFTHDYITWQCAWELTSVRNHCQKSEDLALEVLLDENLIRKVPMSAHIRGNKERLFVDFVYFNIQAICTHCITLRLLDLRSIQPEVQRGLLKARISLAGISKMINLKEATPENLTFYLLSQPESTTSESRKVAKALGRIQFAVEYMRGGSSTKKRVSIKRHGLTVLPVGRSKEKQGHRHEIEDDEVDDHLTANQGHSENIDNTSLSTKEENETELEVIVFRQQSKLNSFLESKQGSWRRLAATGIEIRLVAGCVETSCASPLYPLPREIDHEVRDWKVHIQPVQIYKIREWLLSGHTFGGLAANFQLNHVLTLKARIAGAGIVKTKPVPMDNARGANFSKNNERLTLKSIRGRRRDLRLVISLSRRLSTDLVDTETLGIIEVPLCDVAVANFSQRYAPPQAIERFLTLRRNRRPNGKLQCRIWMQPEHLEMPRALAAIARAPPIVLSLLFSLGSIFWVYYVFGYSLWPTAVLLVSPVILIAVLLELPSLLGAALTTILRVTVPGLNLKFGAIRCFLFLKGSEAGRLHKSSTLTTSLDERELVLAVDVDDFRLQNDPTAGYYYQDFVSASSLRLSIVLNLALLQRSADVLIIFFKQFYARFYAPFQLAQHANGLQPTHLRLSKISLTFVDDHHAHQKTPVHIAIIGGHSGSTVLDHADTDASQHRVRERQRAAKRFALSVVDRTESRRLALLESSRTWTKWAHELNFRKRRGTLTPQSRQRPFSVMLRNSSMKMPRAKDHAGARSGVNFSDRDLPREAVLTASRGTSLLKFVAVGAGDEELGMSRVVQLPAIVTSSGPQEFDMPLYAKASASNDPEEEKIVGWLHFRCRPMVKSHGLTAINWSPFPSLHAALRANPNFEPTRLATIKVRELSVEGVSLAFDIAGGEFNVNRLTRAIADGKVRNALPHRFHRMAPNTLAVRVVSVMGVPGNDRLLRVKVTLRDVVVKTCAQLSHKGVAIWNHAIEIPCPDPSAVIHIQLYETSHMGSTMLGQWMTTVKMLVLDRNNMFGRELTTNELDGDIDTERFPGHQVPSYLVRGQMTLRDKKWLPWLSSIDAAADSTEELLSPVSARRVRTAIERAVPHMQSPELELELCWYHDPIHGLSQDQVLAYQPRTALEQLQLNSAETEKKLGNLALVEKMLEDFPILFDVHALEISHINLYLKPLFSGYRGLGDQEDHSHHHDDSDDEEDDEEHKIFSTRNTTNRRQRGAIYIAKLDLRDALLARGDDEAAGIDVARLTRTLVSALVRPVLSEVSIYSAGRHILGGLFQGFFSKATAVDEDDSTPAQEKTMNNFVRKKHRESVDHFLFALSKYRGAQEQRKYLTWRDQLDLLTTPTIKGRLKRAHISTQIAIRLQRNSSALSKKHKSSLVWCEIHENWFYYVKIGKNGQSRVGLTKLVNLDDENTRAFMGANGELIIRYRRSGAAFRNVVLESYSRNEPSVTEWYETISAGNPERTSMLEVVEAEPENSPVLTDSYDILAKKVAFFSCAAGSICPAFNKSSKDDSATLDESHLSTSVSTILDSSDHDPYPRLLDEEDHAVPSSRVLLGAIGRRPSEHIVVVHHSDIEEEDEEDDFDDEDDDEDSALLEHSIH